MRPLYDRMREALQREMGPDVMREAYGVNMNPYSVRNSSTSEMLNSPNNNGTFGPGTNATRPVSQGSNVENLANQEYFDRYDDMMQGQDPNAPTDIFGIPDFQPERSMREMLEDEFPQGNPAYNRVMGASYKADKSPKSYTYEFQADANQLAKEAVMRQLGITAGAGAAVGTTGLIANSAQQDSNGNLLANPLTGAVASTMGAGAGAYAINQMVSGAPSEKSVAQWDRYEKARGTRAFDAKAQQLHNAQASRVRNRGLRAGAYTAGAVGLLNLMGQLGDQQ